MAGEKARYTEVVGFSAPKNRILRATTWILAVVALMYSVVPIVFGLFGTGAGVFGDSDSNAPVVLLGIGLILFTIGFGLVMALAPGRPRLWCGIVLVVYGLPFLLTALPLGLTLVGAGAWAIYTSQRRFSARVPSAQNTIN